MATGGAATILMQSESADGGHGSAEARVRGRGARPRGASTRPSRGCGSSLSSLMGCGGKEGVHAAIRPIPLLCMGALLSGKGNSPWCAVPAIMVASGHHLEGPWCQLASAAAAAALSPSGGAAEAASCAIATCVCRKRATRGIPASGLAAKGQRGVGTPLQAGVGPSPTMYLSRQVRRQVRPEEEQRSWLKVGGPQCSRKEN